MYGLFEKIDISVLLTIGLNVISIHLCDANNMTVLINRIPCGVGISPRALLIEKTSFPFLTNENAVNQVSVKKIHELCQ